MMGRAKRRCRMPKSCTYCCISCLPRLSRTDNNKNLFFCTLLHFHAHLRENAKTAYAGYRTYILVRDSAKCVLCGAKRTLQTHHIKKRSDGGTDDYRNLITLCRHCHMKKAHGMDAKTFIDTFFAYTSQFPVPDFWGDVMHQSQRDRHRVVQLRRAAWHKRYATMKANGQYVAYREAQILRRRKLSQECREKFGCCYSAYWKRCQKQLKACAKSEA